MAVFTYIPEPDVSRNIRPKVLVSQFGDGYEQRVADGINNRARVWSLSFTRVSTVIDEIEQFLIDRNGVESFDWTPLGESAGKFVCEEWTKKLPILGVNTITATFREVFE